MKVLLEDGIARHAEHLANGDYSALELTQACLNEIEARDGVIGAFLTVDAEGARRTAEESDKRRAAGKSLGALDGIPFALKDNICAKGLRLTCGSRILERYITPYDATVTARLRAAGAVLIGKTNMDEFAMGSSTEYSALGLTRNPHDPARVAGGSSGGSAAAVAAGEAVFSLGTDTGGSVRQPAAFCGVYGLKPTYGALSRYGVAAMATSLDCVGIMARSAADCATVFSALAGRDALDATSVDYPLDAWTAAMRDTGFPTRVAIVRELSGDRISPAVRRAVETVADVLRAHGACIEEVSLPMPEQALASYTVLSCAEASSNLARYDGVRYGRRSERIDGVASLYDNSRAEGFGEEVKRRILFGTDLLTRENRERYYVRAQRVRELIRERILTLTASYDLILTPTTPTTAFLRGVERSPEALYAADLCTVYASLSGVPALSIPVGRDADGLPIAVQLTARPVSEGLLLRTAMLLEEAMG